MPAPGGADRQVADSRALDSRALYVISVAAELAGVHPQTLRMYERRGLVEPARTEGGNRRYSEADIEVLRRVQQMTDQGFNLAGVKRVLELEAEVSELRRQLESVKADASRALAESEAAAKVAVDQTHRQYRREMVPLSQALTLYRGRRR